jgi:thiol-disulfide isomerase/thioredoxin
MTRRRTLELLVLCGFAIAGCSFAWAGSPAATINLKDVLRAWEERTKESRTVRYEWVEKCTEATASLPRDSFFGPAFAPMQKFDTEFVTHSIHHSLQIAAGAVWHQRAGVEWDVDTCRFLEKRSWNYFEKPINIALYVSPEKSKVLPEEAPAIAFIDKRGEYLDRMSGAMPIALHHRALDESVSPLKCKSLKLTTDREIIQQHPCVRLTDGAYSCWVDPDNSFLIRRFERRLTEVSEAVFRADMVYKKDAGGLWVLDSWTDASAYETGKLHTTVEATVTLAELNGKIEPNAKLAEIPIGAVVNEIRGEKRFTYILLTGQQKREITKDDQRYGIPTYQELLNSKPGHAIPKEFIDLRERIRAIGGTSPDEQVLALADLKQYLVGRKPLVRDVALVKDAADRLFRSKEPEAGIRLCREFTGISDILSRALVPKARQLEGDLRRERLLGSEMIVDGDTIEGKKFDWASYRGKIVLLDFWYTGCHGCVEEMPGIKRMYERYHGDGFDVVGISSDQSEQELRQYLAKNEIRWTTIHPSAGTDEANAVRYNVTSFPTYIVVNRVGKVLSLDANGDQLEELIKHALAQK